MKYIDPEIESPRERQKVLIRAPGIDGKPATYKHKRFWVAQGTARGGVPYTGKVTGWAPDEPPVAAAKL